MISKGTHVKLARFVLLAVSEKAKTLTPRFAPYVDRAKHPNIFLRHYKDPQNTKRSTKAAKELFAGM